jgi:hypothetical protein
VAVTRDYGDYGLRTIVRLEVRPDRGCGASSPVVPAVHRDVEAQTGSAAGLANSRDVAFRKTEFCSSLKWGTKGENVGTCIEIIVRSRAF